MAGNLREVQADPRVSAGQSAHDSRGIQEHFLVGVCPPAPGQADRRGIPAAAPVVRAARKIARGLTWKFAVIFGLGALQGALGWYMVKSGLVDNPRVSQYRLTEHLGLAFLIYAAMLWVSLDLLFLRAS